MALNEETRQRISSLIESGDVVLFMKGNRTMPQCGFSGRVVADPGRPARGLQTVDVLADPEIRDGIKEYSTWPTIPQLYVKGEFVGGCDIINELYGTGELHEKLGIAGAGAHGPDHCASPTAAAARIREYMQRAPGETSSSTVDARHQPSLGLATRSGARDRGRGNGIRLRMDIASAERADGLSIDLVESATGRRVQDRQPERARPT